MNQPLRTLVLDHPVSVPAPAPDGSLPGSPAEARVRAAFEAEPLTAAETRAVEALMALPGASAAELSHACGWRGTMWHTHFRALCQRRLTHLPFGGPEAAVHETLAEYDSSRGGFAMKPFAVAAFRALGVGCDL